MIHRKEANIKRSALFTRLFVHFNQFRTLAVLLRFRMNQGACKPGGNDRQIGALFQQPRDGTNMVFMSVCNNERFHPIHLVF